MLLCNLDRIEIMSFTASIRSVVIRHRHPRLRADSLTTLSLNQKDQRKHSRDTIDDEDRTKTCYFGSRSFSERD